jgi:C4-dicarboxylate-binding protein DctP
MRHASIGGIAALAVVFGVGSATAQQIGARLGHCTAPTSDVAHSAELTKEAIERTSNGRVTVQIFGGCQLGSLAAMISQIQLGTLDFFPVPPAFAVGANRNFSVADAPGLFDDADHATRALQNPAFRDRFVNLAKDKGIMAISVWVQSGTAYAATSPIAKLDDFKGKKVRVLATKVETDLMSRYGATGVPVDFAELLPALQQRTVDAARSTILVMAPGKFFTVTKYVTVVDDAFIPLVTFMSTAFYNKLPSDLQKAVLDVGRDVERKMQAPTAKLNQQYEKDWADKGGEVLRFAAADHAEAMRRAKPVGDEIIGTNPETQELYALLKDVAQKTRGR